MTKQGGVAIYTDGACSGNPGPGGWGAVLRYGNCERHLQGGVAHTTNNRMELTAAIEALRALKRPCSVEIYTDSQYLFYGITKWIEDWRRRGWKDPSGTPFKNSDLWHALEEALSPHSVHWNWVRGHTGEEGNELADTLAREGMAPFMTGPREKKNYFRTRSKTSSPDMRDSNNTSCKTICS